MTVKIKLISFCLILQVINVYPQMNESVNIQNNPEILNSLDSYLNKIPPGQEQHFGFSAERHFNQVKLGQSFNIYIVKYNSVNGESLDIAESDIIYIPVILDSAYRCFLLVRKKTTGYKVVGIGYMDIAKELEQFENKFDFKQVENKALLFDPATNILCFVKEALFYPIRSIPNCTSCKDDSNQVLNKTEVLNSIRIINSNLLN